MLAIAILGVVLMWRFNQMLDEQLAPLQLPQRVRVMVDAQRARLAGADLARDLDPTLRQAITLAIGHAYVAGFRLLMLISAGLAALGALAAFCWIRPEHAISPTPSSPAGS